MFFCTRWTLFTHLTITIGKCTMAYLKVSTVIANLKIFLTGHRLRPQRSHIPTNLCVTYLYTLSLGTVNVKNLSVFWRSDLCKNKCVFVRFWRRLFECILWIQIVVFVIRFSAVSMNIECIYPFGAYWEQNWNCENQN